MYLERESVAGINRSLAVILCVALAGCSLARRESHPSPKDSAGHPTSIPSGSAVPQPPLDVLAIPDAVPRVEPRGTRGNPPFYTVFGKRYYVLPSSEGFIERGTASWYGPGFHAAATSLGETYDMYAMTAAHKTLPLPAYAEVTNLRNGRKVVVRINDRGPFVGDRIIDLSYTAAAKLDMLLQGTAPVEVRVISPRSGSSSGSAMPPVTPVAAPPAVIVVNAPATSAPAPNSQVMYIQAGVFGDHENARRRVEVLLAAGIELASLDEVPRNERALHRVRVGPFASVEEFDLTMRRLRELGVTDARLLTD
jgi:rare lipoprotein A